MKRAVKYSGKRKTGRILFMITAGFAMAAVIITSLLLTTGTTTEGKESKTYSRYYSDMVVSANDTLWDLGKRYAGDNESQKEYADNIIKLNNMKDDTIYEGMNIIYYYYVESE